MPDLCFAHIVDESGDVKHCLLRLDHWGEHMIFSAHPPIPTAALDAPSEVPHD